MITLPVMIEAISKSASVEDSSEVYPYAGLLTGGN
jgi:hypothetical protein